MSISGFIKNRILSFTLVIAVGFLLLVSLVLSAGISASNEYWGAAGVSLGVFNFVASIVIITFAIQVAVREKNRVEGRVDRRRDHFAFFCRR